MNRKYSKDLVDGPNQSASRSMLRGVGFTSEDFKKPLVGIASTGAKVTPCNMHINELAEVVESSINNNNGRVFFLHHNCFRWNIHGNSGNEIFFGLKRSCC